MGDRSACSFEGCDRTVLCRALCVGHYGQWSRGKALSPLRAKTSRHAPIGWLRSVVSGDPTDKCILWPYRKSEGGYGRLTVSGTSQQAHRYALALATGADPGPAFEAAHNCGVRACCNPAHLRWDTPKGNTADRKIHGTEAVGERNSKAKLTTSDVCLIRSSSASSKALAAAYGVNVSSINNIRGRRTWRHVE